MFNKLLLHSVLSFSIATAESYFFNFTGGLGPDVAPISAACNDALIAAIDCDLFLTFAMSDSYYGPLNNQTLQDGLCRTSCGNALTSYTSKVTTACKNDPQPFPGLPATYWGEQAKAVYDLFCLKDGSTGKYCTGMLHFSQEPLRSTRPWGNSEP